MTVVALSATVHPVRDLSRARPFYEQRLGLVATPAAGGERRIRYRLGDHTLILAEAREVQPSHSLVLDVDDLVSAVAELRAAGVTVAEVPHAGLPPPVASVQDPDGNTIWLRPPQRDLSGPAIVHQ